MEKPKTILLVEDHHDSRELLADALEFAGFEVTQAREGLDGETQAKRLLPDLILLDISLPLKSGWEVAESLRADETTRHIPIVALTAHARLQDEAKAIEMGFNGYLSKPVKPKQVIETIHRLLNIAVETKGS